MREEEMLLTRLTSIVGAEGKNQTVGEITKTAVRISHFTFVLRYKERDTIRTSFWYITACRWLAKTNFLNFLKKHIIKELRYAG